MKKKDLKINDEIQVNDPGFREKFRKESEDYISTPEYKASMERDQALFKAGLKSEIKNETRLMIFEALETTRVGYEERANRHMTALREGFRDDLRAFRDEFMSLRERIEVLENRF